jgi:hypothetical protein
LIDEEPSVTFTLGDENDEGDRSTHGENDGRENEKTSPLTNDVQFPVSRPEELSGRRELVSLAESRRRREGLTRFRKGRVRPLTKKMIATSKYLMVYWALRTPPVRATFGNAAAIP